MLKTQHETVLIVAVCASIFFGAVAGGMTSYILLQDDALEQETGTEKEGAPVAGLSDETQEAIEGLVKEQEATIAVVEQVTGAVVSIYIEKEYPQYTSSSNGEVTYAYERVGGGTGFIVTPDGLIVTNKHVVSDTEARYIVTLNDGTEYDATILAKDVVLDLAFVKIEGSALPTVSLGDSNEARAGQTVLAIGNALSAYSNSVTKGIISGLDRTITAGTGNGESEVIEEAIQTDAPISEGNSGGPLINLYGEVLGVNTAVSIYGQSLGFAIPINAVKPLLEDVVAYGRIIRPWLGVRYLMIDKAVKEEFELSVEAGALIVPEEATDDRSIVAGSPAALVGLQGGDIIISVDGMTLGEETSLSEAINSFEPEQTVTLEVLRGLETLWIEVTLKELDPSLF
ncbi:MAG: trypsin-like peptidase domain-containing protein [Patescibacteria group bacterium]